MRTLIFSILAVLSCEPRVHGQTQPCPANRSGLRLEEAIGGISGHDSDHPAVFSVKVRVLQDCQPAANQPVRFALPATGLTPGAVFPGGFTSSTVRSDAEGYAVAPPMTPNIFPGDWTVGVSVTAGSAVANLSIAQHNVRTTVSTTATTAKAKSNAWKYALGILLPGGAVAALCGSGHCGGGGGKSADPCAQNPATCALSIGTPQFGPHK